MKLKIFLIFALSLGLFAGLFSACKDSFSNDYKFVNESDIDLRIETNGSPSSFDLVRKGAHIETDSESVYCPKELFFNYYKNDKGIKYIPENVTVDIDGNTITFKTKKEK